MCEAHQLLQKVTFVWILVRRNHWIFENQIVATITFHGELYWSMITNYFWPALNYVDKDDTVLIGWRYVSHNAGHNRHLRMVILMPTKIALPKPSSKYSHCGHLNNVLFDILPQLNRLVVRMFRQYLINHLFYSYLKFENIWWKFLKIPKLIDLCFYLLTSFIIFKGGKFDLRYSINLKAPVILSMFPEFGNILAS